MKCRLRPEIKEFAQGSVIVIIALSLITTILFGLAFLIGYISVQGFDLCMLVSAQSPCEYYVKDGFVLLLIISFIVCLVMIILPPIYIIIKGLLKFKYTWKNIKELILICD